MASMLILPIPTAGQIVTVASPAQLPPSQPEGAIRYSQSDDTIYSYDGVTWTAVAGGGSGAVDSVNGFTGVVVLDTDDIPEGATNFYYTTSRLQTDLNSGTLDAAFDNLSANVISNDVNIEDNIIILNSAVVGVPTLNAGIEVNRGSSTDTQLLWDESADRWYFGLVGSLKPMLLLTDFSALAPLSYNNTSGQFSIPLATTSADGYLSATDWTNFNSGYVAAVVNATSSSLSNTLVKRDGFANFAAGTITATLNGVANNVSGVVAIANGGTGQSNQQAALNNITNAAGATAGDVLQYLGGNAQFASYTAPGTTGSPNTPTYYDAGGLLTSIPGWSIDPNTFGLNIDETSTLDIANFSFRYTNYVLDAANTSDNITLRADNLTINGTLTNSARLYNGDLSGEGTDIFPVNYNITANATNNLQLFNLVSTGSIGNNFQGMFVGNYGPITGNAQFHSVQNQQTVGGYLTFMNQGNDSAIGSQLRFLDWNNSGTVADFFSGLFLNSQGAITKGLDFLALNVSANVGDGSGVNLNGLTINIQNTAIVDGNIWGLNLNNSAVFTGAGNQLVGTYINNQATGDSVRAFTVYNNADLDEEFLGLRVTNDSANHRTGSGLSIDMTGNATDDTRGIRVNVNGLTSSTQRVRSIDLIGATTNVNSEWAPASSLFVDIGNIVFGLVDVPSGSPLSGTDAINNMFVSAMAIQDDVAAGPVGLGLANMGAFTNLGIAAGKTVSGVTSSLAVGGSSQTVPYADGGTIDEYHVIHNIGVVNFGGSLVINKLSAYHAALGFDALATENWGIKIEGTTADNYVNKLAVGTSDTKTDAGYLVEVAGVSKLDQSIAVVEGTADARMGLATLAAGTATVATTAVTTNSRIFMSNQLASGGGPGELQIANRIPGTSFDIISSVGGDTSDIAWFIVEPA